MVWIVDRLLMLSWRIAYSRLRAAAAEGNQPRTVELWRRVMRSCARAADRVTGEG
jgi:hypothetical protein